MRSKTRTTRTIVLVGIILLLLFALVLASAMNNESAGAVCDGNCKPVPTQTKTPRPSGTPTFIPTQEQTVTNTPYPTETPTVEITYEPTASYTPTVTLLPTETTTPTNTQEPTATWTATKPPEETPVLTLVPTSQPTASSTPILTQVKSFVSVRWSQGKQPNPPAQSGTLRLHDVNTGELVWMHPFQVGETLLECAYVEVDGDVSVYATWNGEAIHIMNSQNDTIQLTDGCTLIEIG